MGVLVTLRERLRDAEAENQRLQQSLDARAQNEKNKQRSLGSVKSSGNNKVKDDFLLGFDTE